VEILKQKKLPQIVLAGLVFLLSCIFILGLFLQPMAIKEKLSNLSRDGFFSSLNQQKIKIVNQHSAIKIHQNPLFRLEVLNELLDENGGQVIDDNVTFILVDSFDPHVYETFGWFDGSEVLTYFGYYIEKKDAEVLIYLYLDKNLTDKYGWSDETLALNVQLGVIQALLQATDFRIKNELPDVAGRLNQTFNTGVGGSIFLIEDV
jgi:hypothetical protein